MLIIVATYSNNGDIVQLYRDIVMTLLINSRYQMC